ncbi:MAG: hypothetical protein ABIO57_01975 [Candidatus Paceibacterota bacterium]
MKKTYILLYGGDTCYKGTRLGLESLFRKKELRGFITTHTEYRFEILLAAGSHPIYASYPQLKALTGDRLQSDLTALYNNGSISYIPTITLIGPDVWNTSNESLATALFLEELNVDELFVVSSKTHQIRIEYIWSLIGGFTIHFVGAPTRKYWRSVVYEAFALVKVFLKDRKLLQRRKYSVFQAAKSFAIDY